MDFSQIASVAIYPAIGIARIGNAPGAKDYFLGPAIPGHHAHDNNQFRDTQGRIKRQGARFYVFGLDKDGKVLGELNADNGATIDWRVDVANKKAAWYQFDIALDTQTAAGAYDMDGNATPDGTGRPVLSIKRNREYTGTDRQQLMIEARAQHISGPNKNTDGEQFHLTGKIGPKQTEVYLGELRTDEQGRLIFLGGRGHSAAFLPDKPLTTFANNAGWHDDTSDGPVDAKVTLPDGREMDALGAWVLTAPPNYAVGIQAFSTGYDLLEDVAHQKHAQLRKSQPHFYRDIYPVFQYLSDNQWVNAGVQRIFGWGSAYDFTNETVIAQLTDLSEENRPFRQTIFESFRNPDYQQMEAAAWPPLYGDAITFNIASTDPHNWFALTQLKYDYLRQWAAGECIIDEPTAPKTWEELTPEEQAYGLTQAALEETLGGPFHPGCEFTWPLRHAIFYHDEHPFRIKRRDNAQEDFGVALTQEIALAKGGPLDGCSPGDITKWMAVPWQTDTSSCLSAYQTYAGEYLPTFWPARVPNDVLTEEDFAVLQDPKADIEQKMAAMSPDRRKKWLRGYIYTDQGQVVASKNEGITKFTHEWDKIGIILKQALEEAPDYLPKAVWVETGRHLEGPTLLKMEEHSSAKPPKRPDWVDENPRKHR